MKLFLDADVLFSSSYSKAGAAYELINYSDMMLYTSNECMNETIRALDRYRRKIDTIIFEKVKVINIVIEDARKYEDYVFDAFDAHVVAGAVKCGANILSSYNLKDYRADLIYTKLKISVLKPGEVLSYQRNILV